LCGGVHPRQIGWREITCQERDTAALAKQATKAIEINDGRSHRVSGRIFHGVSSRLGRLVPRRSAIAAVALLSAAVAP